MGSKLPCGEATPMEETVEALLDTLVAPLLPKFYSNRNPPADSLEQSVGKQMHAVVLLYNYFHRKQFPEVKFLDYQPFIKISVIAKKMLLSFVNCGQGGRQTITEKMMMEAFDICKGFNDLTSPPRKDSWPVLKVSVLLVDTTKQNFLLQFGSVIHGVWSMIEKDITTPATHASGPNNLGKQTTPAKKIFRGTQQAKQASCPITLDEEALLQVAYSSVHEKTGLDPSSLMVLRGDYVCSFSKGGSTTRFYLMQCLKEAGEQLEKVPIEDALNSLRHPIVAKVSDGYETTEAVTFFQLFPYEKIISDWISSKNLQPVVGLGNITTPDSSSYSLKENRASDVSQLSDEGSESLSGTENHATDENRLEKDKGCDPRKDERHGENSENLSGSGTENHDTDGKGPRTKKRRHGKGKKCGSETKVDCNVDGSPVNIISDNLKENRILDGRVQSHEISDTVAFHSDHTAHGNDYQKTVPFLKDSLVAEDQVVRPCCKPLEPFHSIGGTTDSSENVTRNQFGTKKSPMRPQSGGMSTKLSAELGIDFSLQDEPAKGNLSVLHFEDRITKGSSMAMMLSSKEHALLQTAVKVLHKKHAKLVHEHQQLSLKLREVQDDIALCEKNIKTVMEGGDEASTFIIETVIEGCDVAPSKEALESYPNLGKGNKRKRLAEAILSLCSPCQELDEICSQNNWAFPTYTVSPSKGGFVASVTVHCLDISCSADGDERSKPQAARESAATRMLKKLRDMADHV
ncbi:unnamed protein product [Victoria cruziana]